MFLAAYRVPSDRVLPEEIEDGLLSQETRMWRRIYESHVRWFARARIDTI